MIPRRFLSLLCLAGLAACAPEASRYATVPAKPPPAPAKPAATAARPVWQARKVVPDAVSVPGGRLHTVKPGETGIAIARAYGVDWGKVAAANGLKPPYTLEVGMRLLLPSASQAAAMTVEERARAFTLNIDDIITGGEPASPGPRVPARKPGAAAPAVAAATPLPAIPGAAPQFRWPVDGRILSGFGAKPNGRFNDGVNLKASAGSAVRVAADGIVAYAGDDIPGFGNLILVKHADGYVTAYAHNEALLVARGQRLKQGEVIARAGATGAVSEPQVHFEIRHNRAAIDPVKVIAPPGRS